MTTPTPTQTTDAPPPKGATASPAPLLTPSQQDELSQAIGRACLAHADGDLEAAKQDLVTIVRTAHPACGMAEAVTLADGIDRAAEHIFEAVGHTARGGKNPLVPGETARAFEADVRAVVVKLLVGFDPQTVAREYAHHLLDFVNPEKLQAIRRLYLDQGGDPGDAPGFQDYAADGLADWSRTSGLLKGVTARSVGLPACFQKAAELMRAVIDRVRAIPGHPGVCSDPRAQGDTGGAALTGSTR